ncbi:TonB-dependent receptor [Echinicola soli]|uniref:TonB-dependent receptor n=1 Tax=Echinicola soli TaxID=2591634 RepID=A0A514CMR8_9BACT|nr:TonB-dependent receptor [Echinicola soli]QDH81119.1 TonB-dependent receptor [Echinicola soli]
MKKSIVSYIKQPGIGMVTAGWLLTASLIIPMPSMSQSIAPRIALEQDSVEMENTAIPPSYGQKTNIAYGTEQALRVTGAMATVNGEALQKTFVPTLSNTLFGRLPGLTVMHGSGEPGYDEPNLLVRGLGTLNDASPLVMVDGFEASFDQLSAYEIESVSVLKDAAAVALYGMRGANGVLLVTTKRGSAGDTQIGFNVRTGFQKPTRLPEFVNAYQYAGLYNEALSNDRLPLRYSEEQLEGYRSGADPYLYPDVNWYNQVLRESAPISDYNLTFSGGSDNTRYFILLGYLQNQGLYANTDGDRKENSNAHFERVNFRSNIDIALSPKVAASLDFGGRIEDRYFPNYDGPGLWENMARYPAGAFPVRNPDGSWGGTTVYPDNPVASVLGRGYTSSHDRNIMANLRLSEDLGDFVPGLRFSQALGINNWHRGNYNRTRSLAFYELLPGEGTEDYRYIQRGLDTGFTVNESGNDQWNRLSLQVGLDYQKKWDSSDLSAMLMYHQDVLFVGGNNVPYAQQRLMGRLAYGVKDTYFTELTFSYSGSERFEKGSRFGFFPALSAAWVASNEDFLKGSNVLTFLKARASVGLAGNDQFGGSRFAYTQDFYYSGDYRLGADNNSIGTIVEGPLANPDIGWEKDLKFNLGLDGQLFKKLDVNVDLFYNRRNNIPIDGSNIYPGYLGVTAPYLNFGTVHNRGFEVNLLYNGSFRDGGYYLGGSISYAKNKIMDMQEITYPESYMQRTGHAIGQPFGWLADGFYQEDDFNADGSLRDGVVSSAFAPVRPGDIKYRDLNGDGTVDQNDETAIGNPWQPVVNYSFTLGVNYKGFDLEALFYGLAGRDVSLNGTYFWALQDDANIGVNALGRWTPETAGSATYPRLTTLPNQHNYRPSDFWQASGNVLRLRNVELGYTVPESLTGKIKVDKVRVFANAVNLLTWDDMEMVDPESYGGYPPLKSFNLGLSVQF